MIWPHSKSCQSGDKLFFPLLIRKSYFDLTTKVRKTPPLPIPGVVYRKKKKKSKKDRAIAQIYL